MDSRCPDLGHADTLDEVDSSEHFRLFHTFSQMGGLRYAQRVSCGMPAPKPFSTV